MNATTDIDPLWLRSFVAVAQTGAITRAAERVHRTQSAVSTHLQQLEASVGARLAERSTRRLALTEAGERFLPHAVRLLALQDEARAAVQPSAGPAVRRIGLSEYFMPHRLPELLALLQAQDRDARLEVLWSSSAALQQLWAAGEMDLVVVTSDAPLAGARLLCREPLSWVAAPDAPPAPGTVPLVLLGPDCPVRRMALAALVRAGRGHHLRLSCSGSHGAVAAIRAGWGVGCLNQSAIPPDLAQPGRGSGAWPAPGRLSFYALARHGMQGAERALQAWAKPR
jgi:DNA-binding transcriptional LysR family regulator